MFFSEFRLYLCNNCISKLPSHRLRLWYYSKVMKFKIGRDSAILMNCRFTEASNLVIGNNCVINAFCTIDTRGGLNLGDNVSISEHCIILTSDHDANSPDFKGRNRMVTISDYCWIGTRAMVLPGNNLEKGCVVAAGSIVTKHVEPYTIVAGIPAKRISNRIEILNYQLNYKRKFQ